MCSGLRTKRPKWLRLSDESWNSAPEWSCLMFLRRKGIFQERRSGGMRDLPRSRGIEMDGKPIKHVQISSMVLRVNGGVGSGSEGAVRFHPHLMISGAGRRGAFGVEGWMVGPEGMYRVLDEARLVRSMEWDHNLDVVISRRRGEAIVDRGRACFCTSPRLQFQGAGAGLDHITSAAAARGMPLLRK